MLITIRVGLASPVVGDIDATNYQRETWLEAMEIESVPYPERESRRSRGGLSRRFHRFLMLHLDSGDGGQRAGGRRQTPEGSRKGRDGTGNGGGGRKGEWSPLGGFGGDGGGQEDGRGSHGETESRRGRDKNSI